MVCEELPLSMRRIRWIPLPASVLSFISVLGCTRTWYICKVNIDGAMKKEEEEKEEDDNKDEKEEEGESEKNKILSDNDDEYL